MCVILLLPGSVVIADKYTIIPEQKGETVQRDGNNVTDEYIRSCRELQVEVDEYRNRIEQEPKEDVKQFKDGLLWGTLGGIVLTILLL